MDTSLAAINNAILENLQQAGEIGLHTADLVRILGFESKGQLLPRLYKLQGENQIQRLDGNKWKILTGGSPPPDFMTCTVPMNEAWCKDKFISYKNILQEYCQKKLLPMPSYKSEKATGGYIGTVSFGSELMKSEVVMASGKEADQRVAFEALKNIQVLPVTAVFNEACPVELPSKKRKSADTMASEPSQKIQLIENGDCLSMKNKLQEIAQKKKLKMPEYEVSGTAQNFMATVTFEGRSFSSKRAFPKKKLAEHDAAHVALYELGYISNPPNGWGIRESMLSSADSAPPGNKNPNENYKNRLQEYLQSKKCKLPEYQTTFQLFDGQGGFISKVIVEGREFRSSFKKTKKEAEKEAAFSALLAIGILTE